MKLKASRAAVDFASKELCTKSYTACEAGISISLGRKPQDRNKNSVRAREAGDSVGWDCAVARFTGLLALVFAALLGLAPQALCCVPSMFDS